MRINFGKHSVFFFDPFWRDGAFFGKRIEYFSNGYYEREFYFGFWTLSIGGFDPVREAAEMGDKSLLLYKSVC